MTDWTCCGLTSRGVPTAVPDRSSIDVIVDALVVLDAPVGCPCSVVELRIDSRRLFVVLDVDAEEHERRRAAGVAAAASTGLLHALWELPEGVSVPFGALDDRDVTTLLAAGDSFVDVLPSGFLRTFRPAGTIRVVGAVGRQLHDAVRQVAGHPPIYQRVAVSTQHSSPDAIDVAHRFGISAVQTSVDGPVVLSGPSGPELGVPAVYRWWVSELAYRAWLHPPYSAAHWTSCSFGSSLTDSFPINP